MKRVLLLCVVIILIGTSGCSHDSRKDAIRVMTLNVRYDNPDDSANAWSDRSAIVCNFIKAERPDIFGMQEVVLNQFELLDSLLKGYISVGVGRSDGSKAGEMNPIFFRKERFDMTRSKTFWLSETPEMPGSQSWEAGSPRIVTWMELVDKESHEHFFFFNTHFDHDSDSARIMSSKLLLEKVDSIASGFPFIITGDFNMRPDSKGYAILTGPAESVPLLRDSFVISEKNPDGPLFTFNRFSDKLGKGRVDYIFVKDGLKVLDHKTIIKKEQGVFISDHWPLEAVVSLK